MAILCCGDSNTYGYAPSGRHPVRWVDILAQKTGRIFVNDGVNGRRIPQTPVPVPDSAELLIVMLGTNDLLQGLSPAETTRRMQTFLEAPPLPKERLLLIAPPPMQPGDWVPTPQLVDASAALGAAYRALAEQLGIPFADAGRWSIPLTHDGVHFTQEGHWRFAEGLYAEYFAKGER